MSLKYALVLVKNERYLQIYVEIVGSDSDWTQGKLSIKKEKHHELKFIPENYLYYGSVTLIMI